MTVTAIRQRAPGVYVEWLDANRQQLDVGRTDVAGFIGIAERGPVHAPVKIESMRQFVTVFGAHIERGCLAYAVEGFFANGGRTCWVVRVTDASAQPARLRIKVPGRGTLVVEAVSSGTWGNRIELGPLWSRDTIVGLTAREEGRPSQVIRFEDEPDSVSAVHPGPADEAVVQELAQEQLVRRQWDSSGDGVPLFGMGRRQLEGGLDGLDDLRAAHFAGDPEASKTWGVDALSRIDNVSFVAAPDLVFAGFAEDVLRQAQIDILSRCVTRRDRIALLDLPRERQNEVIRYVRAPGGAGLPDESFGAAYHPWIRVDDPVRLRGNTREIPPSGHVAGMFARVDRLRGVYKPPANEMLEGVWDLFENIDDDAHAALNDLGINAIRALPGRGVRVLGARTLCTRDRTWRYVNVRRLFAMVEEALDEQLQWLVFEPNNPRLWRDIDRAVRGFLERLFRAGMLDGETSEDAYFVRCDATTNPPELTDIGRVSCEIGLRPAWPAEFVIVRIGVTRSGIQVEEKGAQDV